MTDATATPAALATPHADLSRLLHPRGVAIVGVSNDAMRIGGQALRLLTDFGYAGRIYPVNPKYGDIKGLTCYTDLLSVPQPCDVALIALSAERVTDAIEQCGQAGIPFALVLAGGFAEAGEEGKRLQASLSATARKANVRVLGPNCLGILNLKDNARIGFGGAAQLRTLKPGPMAMVTQSGGFGFGVAAMAAYCGVGCNYAVSTGNEADLGLLDFLADLIERPEVEIVVAFMESIDDGRRLIAIGERALELGKPILAWKVGNTEVGSRAATSHSARMTTRYALYRAAFAQGGLVEIREADEMVDVVKAFLLHKLPAGNRVGILTLSGGAGVLLADRCIEHGLALPPLAPSTTDALRRTLVSFASCSNPVDATAHGYNDDFASYTEALRLVLADPNIDLAMVRVPRGRGALAWAENLVKTLRDVAKPVVLNWPSAPDDNGDVLAYLEGQGVPCILGAGRAARALAALTDFARRRRGREPQGKRASQRVVAHQALELPSGAGTLGERRSKQILERYGVPVVREVCLQPHEIDDLEAAPLAFPVAVKIDSPDVPHKSDAGAVRLGIQSLAGLKQAARDVLAATRQHQPEARIEGILVQEMACGLEVIVGAVNDPCFGPTATFGLGGVLTELLEDMTYGFAPFDAQAARRMILEIKGARLLDGYRGHPKRDVAALADTLARISLLIADHGDRISEIDVNPLFVREQGVVAVDALIVLKG